MRYKGGSPSNRSYIAGGRRYVFGSTPQYQTGLVYEGDVALLIAAYPNTFERMEA